MMALDSSVLLRFVLADDHDAHTAVAERWMRRHARDGIYVDHVVLCEVLWVLQARYHWRRPAVATLVEDLLGTNGLAFGDDAIVRRSLDAYRAGRGDFSDYLIRERARDADAHPMATFDRVIGREKGFQLLG